MNIQQISPDRLRVTLDPPDLDKYDLDYFSISKESAGTKRLLKEILSRAQKDGFSSVNSKILIEVLPGKSGSCILYVTKMPREKQPVKKQEGEDSSKKGYILCCDSLEDALSAINRFAYYPDIPIKSSAMYYFDENYYLVFTPVRLGLDLDRLVSLLTALSEYGDTETNTPVREALLAEHGNVIAPTRAVESIIQYFYH